LLDKEYELAAGYSTPGLSGYAGLRYAPTGE
jgi:outer membrane cobalamin receptor